jgi:type IV secretion system protein VirB5
MAARTGRFGGGAAVILFKKKKQPEPAKSAPGANPFLDAKTEWLERHGDYIAAAASWRQIAALALIALLASLAGNFFQLSKAKVIPYIIEVDKLGAATAVRPLQQSADVPRRLIQAEIVNVIANWRTVTADLDLQKKLVGRLAAFIGGSATGTIQEWYKSNNPYIRAHEVLVSVDVSGQPQPVSADSWRVSWQETTRNHTGATLDTTRYEATVTIALVPPKDEAQVIVNPGGVMVIGLSFGKLFN